MKYIILFILCLIALISIKSTTINNKVVKPQKTIENYDYNHKKVPDYYSIININVVQRCFKDSSLKHCSTINSPYALIRLYNIEYPNVRYDVLTDVNGHFNKKIPIGVYDMKIIDTLIINGCSSIHINKYNICILTKTIEVKKDIINNIKCKL